jgi:hypothetical protein
MEALIEGSADDQAGDTVYGGKIGALNEAKTFWWMSQKS